MPPPPTGPARGTALPATPRPAAARSAVAPPASQAPAPKGIPLALATGLIGLGGLVLSMAVALGLSQLAVPGLDPAWSAALGAGLGFAAAALPLIWLSQRLSTGLSDETEQQPADRPQGASMARPLFMELAEREWARARRYGSGAALMLVDLDRPPRLAADPAASELVDALLHQLLRQTASTLRPADMITRFAETRLAVFLTHSDATGALDVAERIRERVEKLELPQPRALKSGKPMRWSASLGVAHLRPAHLHLTALIEDAEDALAAARQAGGNCVRAAPVEPSRHSAGNSWRGDERRARPKQGGPS